jgi:hypothetical protein
MFGLMVFYVQYMNNNRTSEVDHRSLQMLNDLSNNDSITQRDLSGRLGIVLGLVNTYINQNEIYAEYMYCRTIGRS